MNRVTIMTGCRNRTRDWNRFGFKFRGSLTHWLSKFPRVLASMGFPRRCFVKVNEHYVQSKVG